MVIHRECQENMLQSFNLWSEGQQSVKKFSIAESLNLGVQDIQKTEDHFLHPQLRKGQGSHQKV